MNAVIWFLQSTLTEILGCNLKRYRVSLIITYLFRHISNHILHCLWYDRRLPNLIVLKVSLNTTKLNRYDMMYRDLLRIQCPFFLMIFFAHTIIIVSGFSDNGVFNWGYGKVLVLINNFETVKLLVNLNFKVLLVVLVASVRLLQLLFMWFSRNIDLAVDLADVLYNFRSEFFVLEPWLRVKKWSLLILTILYYFIGPNEVTPILPVINVW